MKCCGSSSNVSFWARPSSAHGPRVHGFSVGRGRRPGIAALTGQVASERESGARAGSGTGRRIARVREKSCEAPVRLLVLAADVVELDCVLAVAQLMSADQAITQVARDHVPDGCAGGDV